MLVPGESSRKAGAAGTSSTSNARAGRAGHGQNKTEKLVVVGSSAGGIQALSVLVGELPADFPAAIVLAQHLDPQRPSNLAEILDRRTSLPVVTVTDDTPL